MAKKETKSGKVTPKKDAAEELKDFMVDGLKDLYWAEKALVKSLPKMVKNATSKKTKRCSKSTFKRNQKSGCTTRKYF